MRALWLAGGLLVAACATDAQHGAASSVSTTNPSQQRVRALREREGALRSRLSPAQQPPWLDVSGADPYRIAARDGAAGGFVGILRGSKALVTLDDQLSELGRASLSEAPTALCLLSSSAALVASRYAPQVWRFELGAPPRLLEQWQLDSDGIVELACGGDGPGYALTSDDKLVTFDAHGRVLDRRAASPGGMRLLRRGRYLLESSLFERSLRVLGLDARGVPGPELGRIRHDGPLWAFDALVRGSELLIAVAGVEDKPLVRAHGEFENIDSYVWLYRAGDRFERLAELNVSEQGVVVPKAIALSSAAAGLTLSVLAAGSGRIARAHFSGEQWAAPELSSEPALPGVSDAVFAPDGTVSYASPLLDAWVRLDRAGSHSVRVEPERRPEPGVRLGEALFFTELMAPDNVSAGGHSRFSCETCHFEGGVDGRMHYSGRADISVVTKPLFGLANNRPHFSRALDRDLSSVCHSEFRVAGAGSGSDPWFSLSGARFPWLHELGVVSGDVSPLELRGALLEFLYAFSHAPNARAQTRTQFSELEARGAAAFRDHCAGCHAPRLVSDDSSSDVPFAAWQGYVLSRNAPIVWARGEYAKTGIVPYVHERGTRITSLRRLSLKPRYFSNGSSADLGSVLERFREAPAGALHAAPGQQLAELPEATRRALLAFLQLL